MYALFRRICSRKTARLVLNNITKNPVHGKPHILSAIQMEYNPNLQFWRFKSKNTKSKTSQNVLESETEVEEKDEDSLAYINDKHTKTMTINVPTMRVDAMLKSGLGLSRNKIEVSFYSSNIRVNGEKILKKSISVQEGDEIDVVKGTSPTNPDFLLVARVEILSVKGEEESIRVKIRRCKSLTIQNYEGKDKWSPSQSSPE